MSEIRPPTEKEKRIINRLALEDYQRAQMRNSLASMHREGQKTFVEFRLPYSEVDIEPIDEKLPGSMRKSAHDLLIESLGGKCKVCGSMNDLEAHHIIPLEKGGPDNAQNLTVLCRECHVKTF